MKPTLLFRFTASDGTSGDTAATTTIAVDNVAIIPEPATAMLALAGPGLPGIPRR